MDSGFMAWIAHSGADLRRLPRDALRDLLGRAAMGGLRLAFLMHKSCTTQVLSPYRITGDPGCGVVEVLARLWSPLEPPTGRLIGVAHIKRGHTPWMASRRPVRMASMKVA